MNEMFDSYSRRTLVAKANLVCCECHSEIRKGQKYERMRCCFEEDGAGHVVKFMTCETCRDVRKEFCTEFFTPSGLVQDLETMRSALPYDSIRQWSLLTNAISNLRVSAARARAVPALTPLPAALGVCRQRGV